MRLLFCGDFVLSDTTDISVSDSLKHYIIQHDYKIINFEAPILSQNSCKPIIKAGPHVKNNPCAVTCLKTIGINIAGLANNHIMDYGINAFFHTKAMLENSGIKTFGAGGSFAEAYAPLLIEEAGERLALFNVCQAEFGVMKNASLKAGYAWINHPIVTKQITKYKSKGYRVIIFAHAGIEDEEYVLPEWRDRYHEFIESGADYVIASHPHILQGVEKLKWGGVCYSLGNFYFPTANKTEDWTTSLLFSIDTNSATYETRIIHFTDAMLDFCETPETIEKLKKRSMYVSDERVLENGANKLAEKVWNRYYRSYYENLEPHTLKGILKEKAKKIVRKSGNETVNETLLLHNIQIESHRWCVERYLYNMNVQNNGFISC